MSELNFIDFLSPVTDDEIINLENLIGSKLPYEMKRIYRKYNGGQPQPSFVHGERYLYVINSFFSITEIDESYNDFEDEVLPDNFSKHEMLPFAYDDGYGILNLFEKN